MNEFIILPKNKKTQETVQKILFKMGYKWYSEPHNKIFNIDNDSRFLVIDDDSEITLADEPYNEAKPISIGKFIDKWMKKQPDDEIRINDVRVEFTDGGIKVGCQEVSKETLLKIVDKLK